ncbi:MAG: SUMF1/EgtB/PvdO family nonheme iron enzyme [Gammaproteobacteria bacterium]|nr:SUMF1/EgtB/PvdO family nonheme iron enzyme [Gammaproteobacteria bacterium]
MTDKDQITSRIKELEGALSNAHEEKVRLATGKVDMVEHQALRQEVEALRKTIKEMQQDLEHATSQGRITEDELEDRNGVIEQMDAEMQSLKQALQAAEERRQQAEEGRVQAESRAALMLEKIDSLQNAEAPAPQGASLPSLLKGAALGAGVCFLLFEVISFSSGKGELFSYLSARPLAPASYARPQTTDEPAKPIEPAEPSLTERETPTEPPGPRPLAGRSDGNRIIEDPEASYALIALTGGEFMMGNRTGVIAEESPYHAVNLKPYLIGRSEVTFDLYDRFAQATGRALPDDNGWGRGSMPVINISWEDAQALAAWLSQRTGKKYRLPTEAEWEYAAGASRESPYWWGYEVGENNANCFNCNSQYDRRSPAPVETFKVNPFGLHSSAGNVQEWVQDCYRKGYAQASGDGTAVEIPDCSHRVARGGSFNKPADNMKVTRRSNYPAATQVPHLGLRLARDPD